MKSFWIQKGTQRLMIVVVWFVQECRIQRAKCSEIQVGNSEEDRRRRVQNMGKCWRPVEWSSRRMFGQTHFQTPQSHVFHILIICHSSSKKLVFC